MYYISLAYDIWEDDGYLEWTLKFASEDDAQAYIEAFHAVDNAKKKHLFLNANNQKQTIFPITDTTIMFRHVPDDTTVPPYNPEALIDQLVERAEAKLHFLKSARVETPYVEEDYASLQYPHEHDVYECLVLKRKEDEEEVELPTKRYSKMIFMMELFATFFDAKDRQTEKEVAFAATPADGVYMKVSMDYLYRTMYYTTWQFIPIIRNHKLQD